MHSFPALLPDIRTPVPGPRSRQLAARLQRVECPETTYIGAAFPVFWERAAGANVWDADGNRYIDLTAAFGVALAGHAHPVVAAAIAAQAAALVHGMGDVHPTALKVEVAEQLAALAPGDLSVSLFGNAGFEAIEAAIKTATLVTGRAGVLAFEGGYHGLGYGALAATSRPFFRQAFAAQLNPHVSRLPFPDSGPAAAAAALERVDAALAADADLGCVIVEPVQGRAGIRVPDPSFLAGLREICTRRGRLLVADEILTGLGRTGRWFACEHSGVEPDLLCAGKVLGGGLPLSVCIGTPALMQAWGVSTGEARHTTTHLGNPLACAAALATLRVLRELDAPARAAVRGGALRHALSSLPGTEPPHGLGLLCGVRVRPAFGLSGAARARAAVEGALRRGVFVLADGDAHDVLTCMPPLCLDDAQLDVAARAIADALAERA